MNLLGPELVRDPVWLIQRTEADDAIRVLVFREMDMARMLSDSMTFDRKEDAQ
jgi:hypothetical protein